MNFTARIKQPTNPLRSARAQPQYVLNLSIDIPLKSKYAITHRQLETSLSPSPNKLKKRYKLSITPVHQKKTMNTSNIQTIRDLPYYQSFIHNKKKSMALPQHSKTLTNHIKNKSCEVSPKRKPTCKKLKHIKKTIKNISILDQVVEDQDNIIKYTSNSSEAKSSSKMKVREKYNESNIEQQQENTFRRKLTTELSEDIDFYEIRSYENKAIEKKEHLNYLYIKEKILVLASVKKIQRAWRNYKTKALLKSYSTDIRLKLIRSISNHDEDQLNSVRSQGRGLKLKKITAVEKSSILISTKRNKNEIEKIKQIQQQYSQRWDQLNQQIKSGNHIDNILLNSQRRREELKTQINQIQGTKPRSKSYYEKIKEEKISYSNHQTHQLASPESNQNSFSLSEVEGEDTVKRKQKIEHFQNEMLKLENDYSEASNQSFHLSGENQELNLSEEEIETIKLRKKLQLFNFHLTNLKPNQPEGKINQKEIPKQLKRSTNFQQRLDISSIVQRKRQHQTKFIKEQEQRQGQGQEIQIKKQLVDLPEISPPALTHRQYTMNKSYDIDVSSFQTMFSQNEKELKMQLKKLKSRDTEDLVQMLQDELIYESLLSFSESDSIIKAIKDIYEEKKERQRVRKPEGISTSLASIKDYLENLATYIFQFEKVDLTQRLNRPVGPTPIVLLKYLRGEDVEEEQESEFVMTIHTFNRHWDYASEMIYFDPKFPEVEREDERVNYLKQLTKVFFRAIFDGFNQSLENQRLHGLTGKPYPWSLTDLKSNKPNVKTAFKYAYRRVLSISVVFCGVHFEDKTHSLSEDTIKEIKEENMHKLLEIQSSEELYRWSFFEDQLAEIKYEVSVFIEKLLFNQVVSLLETDFY